MTKTPLKIKCSNTDCPNDLHFFRREPRTKDEKAYGPCNECGAVRIDWRQPHERKIEDVETTIKQLQLEWIRHHYWHADIDPRAINYALRKGRIALAESVRRRLAVSIGGANPWKDGAQTPFHGPNPTCYAQHATASCCRKCVAEWHGLARGAELTSEDLDYLTRLAMRYLEIRIPGLTDSPQRVPRLTKKKAAA